MQQHRSCAAGDIDHRTAKPISFLRSDDSATAASDVTGHWVIGPVAAHVGADLGLLLRWYALHASMILQSCFKTLYRLCKSVFHRDPTTERRCSGRTFAFVILRSITSGSIESASESPRSGERTPRRFASFLLSSW